MGMCATIMRVLPDAATFEMLFNFAQFTGLCNLLVLRLKAMYIVDGIEIPGFITNWTRLFFWTNFFVMDLKEIGISMPDVEDLQWMLALDWQTQFLVLTILIPLLFSLTTLLLFKSTFQVMWL